MLLAPMAALYVPGGHGSKTMLVSAPSAAQNPPAPHSWHWVCPRASVYLPEGQLVHLEAPEASLNRPEAQLMQLALLVAPSAGRYVPAPHGSGMVLPALQKWPFEQGISAQSGVVKLAAVPK